MLGEVKPIFTGERALGSYIKQKADKGYYYYFPLFDGFEGRQIHMRLVMTSEENLTVRRIDGSSEWLRKELCWGSYAYGSLPMNRIGRLLRLCARHTLRIVGTDKVAITSQVST